MKFAGGGLGNIAYHAASGINEKGYLKKVLTPAYKRSEIDSKLIKTFPFGTLTDQIHSRIRNNYIKDTIFDKWASHHIEDCDIFYGWAHHSLYSIKKAKEHGAITFIDRGSAEITTQNNILKNEYAKHSLKIAPIDKRIIERSLQEYDEVDYIAVPSTFVYNTFIESGYPEEKLFLNSLGVDTKKFKPAEKDDDIFRVLFIGGNVIRKGLVYVLQVWHKLNLKNAELVIRAPKNELLKVGIEKYMKRNNIRIVGHIKSLDKLYTNSSLFVFLSNEDGFGMVVTEAMASGLPVIVSENTGAKDCVRNKKDGYILNPNDFNQLEQMILNLYNDQSKCNAMGESARKNVLKYTWENYQKRLIDKFEEIVP